MADLSDQIEQAAGKASRLQSDAGSIDNRPLPELIAADEYLAQKAAAKRRRPPLRRFKMRPPGTQS